MDIKEIFWENVFWHIEQKGLSPRDVIGAFLSLKGGEKKFFEKIQIWFVQIEKNFPVG